MKTKNRIAVSVFITAFAFGLNITGVLPILGILNEKYQQYGTGMDVYYKAGHLFRSVSALNQVLFALNRTYCLNEKKATLRINQLRIAPQCYHERVNKIFSLCGEDTSGAVEILRQLIDEVETEIHK